MRNKEKLLKKIKTLSEKGVGGEKESAEKLLLQLMEKYKITEDEFRKIQLSSNGSDIKTIYKKGY